MLTSRIRIFLTCATLLCLIASFAPAQTITTGEIAGTVTDSTGAVVPNATVTAKEVNTGDLRTVVSAANGAYRLSLLKPGAYQVTATAQGLKSDILANISVVVGQTLSLNVVVKPQATQQSVTVTDAAPMIRTENANITANISAQQMEMLPTPGGDITTVAFTLPGIIMSTGAGYGNFSSHGLPSNANLFTVNGNDNMDPYLNLNNTGASNLTLGSNEIDQATVVQNAYSAQFGRQAGAQVNYITKSGTNDFHGGLNYSYNGSFMNANDFFNNASDTPRGRSLSNQYGANLGGRIVRDKLFFFASTEGIRYVLPTTGVVSIPSAELQTYTLNHITSAQKPFYQKAFDLYNKAPGANRAIKVVNGDGLLQDSLEAMGCGTLAGTPTGVGNGVFGENVSCANAFGTNLSNMNKEWQFATRVDYRINDSHSVYWRFKSDHGLQPTETSPIGPIFNAVSDQPSYEGQFDHTWVISPRAVNKFLGSGSWYSAIFSPADLTASLAAFPHEILWADGGANGTGGFSQMGVSNDLFPQGRQVGQMLLSDDLSYNLGSHSLKVGFNYRQNRVQDTGNQRYVKGGRFFMYGVDEFANGAIDPASGSTYAQRFTPYPVVNLRVYNVGFYAQDEWAVRPDLKLTLALRMDRNSNPSCVEDCFARFAKPFAELDKSASVPFNQSIIVGNEKAFYDMDALVFQPRFGFVFSPGAKTTVFRGGIGIFSDQFPANLAGSVFGNTPNVYTPALRFGQINASGAGSAPDAAVITGNTFQTAFKNGSTLAQIQSALSATGVTFTPPAFFDMAAKLHNPKYLQWSFEIERQLFSPDNVLTVSYVGNHGYDLFLRNLKTNASASATSYPNGIAGIPATAPDTRFRIITTLNNANYSNYEGLSASYRRGLRHGLQASFDYTWSHALDVVSNGGLTTYYSGDSLTSQNDYKSVSALNYSNADYDVRHNFTVTMSWEIPVKVQNVAAKKVVEGWNVSSKWYVRTGTPFSILNSRIPSRLSASTGGNVLAEVTDMNIARSCTSPDKACFSTSQFKTYTTQQTLGNFPRNSFRAPGYFDIDVSVQKNLPITEKVRFVIGATATNFLNHTNFGSPGFDVAAGGLGVISHTVSAPTSPYGSFQGSAVSGRVIVLEGKFKF